MFKPELLNTMKGYDGKTFVSDLIAGVIVGIVALPLAIAFAIASGVGPAAGIFTAIIARFILPFQGRIFLFPLFFIKTGVRGKSIFGKMLFLQT